MKKTLSLREGLSCILAVSMLMLAGCGAKGPLSMSAYEKPDTVSNLRAVHREKAVTISWSYPGGEKYFISGFVIERTESGQQWRRLAVLPTDATSYVDTSFVPGAAYQYRVMAVSKKDRLSDVPSAIRVAPRDLPAAPSGLEAKATVEGMELRWNTVGSDVKYNVYKTTVSGTCGGTLASGAPLDAPVFRDAANPASTVYYCVRSLYATDILDEGFPSTEYAVAPGIYIPGRIAELRGIAAEQGVQLIWGERPEHWVKTYRIFRKLKNENELRMIGETLIPAYLDDTPDSAAAQYAVEAVGPEQTGQRSEPVLVVPYQAP